MNIGLDKELPFISVVVPVLNEGQFIKRTLEYLCGQNYPRDKFEVLVVDGLSEDDTRDIVTDFASADKRVKLLDNPRKLSSAARNIGARAASGEIVVYIDGHVYIDNNDLLKNTASLMDSKDVCVLSRPQFLDTPENDFMQQAVSLARKSVIGHGLDSTIYTDREGYVDPTSSGASYRREVFEKAGYFDESFDAAEDLDFNYRVSVAGYKAYTAPVLAVYYYPRSTIVSLFRQMSRYGTGRFRFLRKHLETFSPGSLAPTILAVGLLAFLVLSPWITTIPFLLLAGSYLVIILAASTVISIRKGIRHLPTLPPIFLAIHFGLAWGFISEATRSLFRRGQS